MSHSAAHQQAAATIGRTLERNNVRAEDSGHSLGQPDIRLLQAYLRALGYFGNPEIIRGVDVVNGTFDARTRAAAEAFVREQGAVHNVTSVSASRGLLSAVRHHYNRWIEGANATASAQAELDELDRAFRRDGHHPWQTTLLKLHPEMRYPLAAALNELYAKGIRVTLTEGYRAPEKQEGLVKDGSSTAPPGWSLHGYGLAVDIAPENATGKDRYNPQSPQWQTIISVMQRHGFSSLYREQGWDLPHFELPVKTARLVQWAHDDAGWKIIPDDTLPPAWNAINQRALSRSVAQK